MGHTTSHEQVKNEFKQKIRTLKGSKVYEENETWFDQKIDHYESEKDKEQKSVEYLASYNLIDKFNTDNSFVNIKSDYDNDLKVIKNNVIATAAGFRM